VVFIVLLLIFCLFAGSLPAVYTALYLLCKA